MCLNFIDSAFNILFEKLDGFEFVGINQKLQKPPKKIEPQKGSQFCPKERYFSFEKKNDFRSVQVYFTHLCLTY